MNNKRVRRRGPGYRRRLNPVAVQAPSQSRDLFETALPVVEAKTVIGALEPQLQPQPDPKPGLPQEAAPADEAQSIKAVIPAPLQPGPRPRGRKSWNADQFRWAELCAAAYQQRFIAKAKGSVSGKIKRRRGEGKLAETVAEQVAELQLPEGPAQERAAVQLAEKLSKSVLPSQPKEQRRRSLKRVNAAVQNSIVPDEASMARDKQSRSSMKMRGQQWFAVEPESGRILAAKPDFTEIWQRQDGTWVLTIEDEKTSVMLTPSHKDQIRFFGLVVYLAVERQIAEAVAKGEAPVEFEIELVVKLTAKKLARGQKRVNKVAVDEADRKPKKRAVPAEQKRREQPFKSLLDRVRNAIKLDDERTAANEWLATPNHSCYVCEFKKTCVAYRTQETANTQQPSVAPPQELSANVARQVAEATFGAGNKRAGVDGEKTA